MKILGIDLAGKDENPSGICYLENDQMDLFTIYTDEDILECINALKPSLIVIDAPLSLPRGRCCLEKECKCAVGGHFRQAEREIRSYGRVLPLTFHGMKMLTLRGVEISSRIKKNYEIIESHPRTSQKILGFKDPHLDLSHFYDISHVASEHELDASILASTGWLHKNNCSIELGDPNEGIITLPKSSKCLDCLKV